MKKEIEISPELTGMMAQLLNVIKQFLSKPISSLLTLVSFVIAPICYAQNTIPIQQIETESYWSSIPYLETLTSSTISLETPEDALTTLTLDLRRCVEIGLSNNFDLINARRNLEIQQSVLREERSFFIPFVDLIGNYTVGQDRTRDDLGNRIQTDNDQEEGRINITQNLPTGGSLGAFGAVTRDYVTEGSAYTSEVGLSFSQPLLREGGFAVGLADLRTAELTTQSSLMSLRISERDTALNIIRQYFLILQAKLEIQVSRDALAEKLRFLEETQMKFDLDEVPESEVSRAEIQYLQEQERYTSRLQSYENRIDGLLILLSLPMDSRIAIVDITEPLIELPIEPIGNTDDYIRESQALRLELRQRDIAIQRAKISLDVARNELLPFLDFSAETRSYQTDPYFDTTRDLDYNTWSAGLGLRIPLPNIARREAFRRAILQLEQQKTERLSLERDIAQEVKQICRQLRSNEHSLTILLKTVEQARKSLEQEKARFEFGLNTSVDVRLAQDDLFEAQSQYYTAVLNRQIYVAQLYIAIGRPLF